MYNWEKAHNEFVIIDIDRACQIFLAQIFVDQDFKLLWGAGDILKDSSEVNAFHMMKSMHPRSELLIE